MLRSHDKITVITRVVENILMFVKLVILYDHSNFTYFTGDVIHYWMYECI